MTKRAAGALPPDSVTTWQDLVLWLADTHHKGHVYPMAKRTRTSAGTVRQWADGIIQVPKLESALAVAMAYGIPTDVILAVARPKGPTALVRDEAGRRIRTKAQAAARKQALAALEGQQAAPDGVPEGDAMLVPPGAA